MYGDHGSILAFENTEMWKPFYRDDIEIVYAGTNWFLPANNLDFNPQKRYVKIYM